MIEVTLIVDKETKNTVRYRAGNPAAEGVMEYAYVQKAALAAKYGEDRWPDRIKITVEAM